MDVLTEAEQKQLLYETLRTTAYGEFKNHETLYDFQVAMFRIAQDVIATSPFINDVTTARVAYTVERITTWVWERFTEVKA